MNRSSISPLVALALAGVTSLSAQVDDRRLQRLDAGTRTAMAAVLDSARAARLPLEPLVEKALEGVSKGAPGTRIVAAVRALAGDLAAARAALSAGASVPELEIAAGALRAGARPEDLAALRERRPRRSLIVPLGVLVDLVASGVPPDTAAAAVLALAGRADDDDFLAFRRGVERDIALGAPPAAATAVHVNAAVRESGVRRP